MVKAAPSLLFIKLKHFGDVLLLTPTLASVRQAYPQAHITVLVREGTEQMLEGSGLVDQVLITVPPEKSRRSISRFADQIRLLQKLREREYDLVFELTDGDRGRWLGAFAKARLRCASTYGWTPNAFWRFFYDGLDPSIWHLCHSTEKDHRHTRQFLPLMAEETPPLVFHPAQDFEVPTSPYVVLHPASRWKRKLWPLEHWVAVGRHLTAKGLHCVISSGPDEEEVAFAQEMQAQIGPLASFTGGRLRWGQLGALIKHAQLFVGIDTAAMHLAAACQTCVVALFGPSIDHYWHPWKSDYEIVGPGEPLHDRFPDFIYDAPKRSMQDIQVKNVISACNRMLAEKEVAA